MTPGVLAPTYHQQGIHGQVPQRTRVRVASGQTIKRMDLLTQASSQMSQAIAAPAVNTLTASGGNVASLYQATCDAYVDIIDGLTYVDICQLTQDTPVYLHLYNATASASEQQDVNLETYYQFGRYTNAAGVSFYVLTTTTTNGEFKPAEFYNGDALDTDYGVVKATYKPSLAL